MANYAFTSRNPLPESKSGEVFENLNFTQMLPNTEIFTGVTGLVFKNCNLTNCKLPDDAKAESCLRVQIEFCSNLHPKWTDKGLSACGINCSHVVNIDEIRIDGALIDTIYDYEDKVVK